MGGHELTYFAIVVEHCDAWDLGLLEAAERDTTWEFVLVAHISL